MVLNIRLSDCFIKCHPIILVNGFCISMWFSMNSLPEFTRTALPLVTVCRNVQNGKTSYVVFSILITKHKELIISTRELSQAVHNQLEELELDPERCAKVVQNFDAVDSGIGSIVDFIFSILPWKTSNHRFRGIFPS